MSAYTSLDSAIATGPGEDRRLLKATAHHTMAVTLTGQPTTVEVVIEGSHTGYDWFPMGTLQCALIGGLKTLPATTHLVTYIRANLTRLEGGDSPTVTATIASADDE